MSSVLRDGWKIKELGEVAIISSGSSAPQKKELFNNGTFPFIRTSDVGKIKKGTIDSCVDYLNEEGIKKLRLFKKGTILFPKSGASTFLNHRVLLKTDAYVSSHLATIKVNDMCKDEFIWYYLITVDAKDLMQDIAYPSLKLSDIKQIPTPIPSLQEQQRIVIILDEAFNTIEKAKVNTELNLKNTKELFENYLQSMFDNRGEDWEEKSLGEMATFRNGMNFTKASKGEEIQIVGVKNFQKSFWVPSENLESVIIDGNLNEIDLLKEGDILAVRSNGNPKLIGRTLLTGNISEKIAHSGFTIRIRLNSDIIVPIYLCHYLKTKKTREELINSGNGVGIKSLNQGSLSSLLIPFPTTIKEQKTIVKKLDTLSEQTKKLESIYQQKLSDLEELKKSILQKAFNGKLT